MLFVEALEPRQLLAVDLAVEIFTATATQPNTEHSFSVQVQNLGDEPAINAHLELITDNALANLRWIQNGSGDVSTAGPLSVDLNLDAGTSVSYRVTGLVVGDLGDSINMLATASTGAGQTDVNSNNDQAASSIGIRRIVNIELETTDFPSNTLTLGETGYRFSVRNDGPDVATDVRFEVPFDQHLKASDWTLRKRIYGYQRDGSTSFSVRGQLGADGAGERASGIGDFNGDGLSDIAITAAGYDAPGQNDVGQVIIVFGTTSSRDDSLVPSELNGNNGFVINGSAEVSFVGQHLTGLGDINGDALDDFLISATINEKHHYAIIYGNVNGVAGSMDLLSLDGVDGTLIETEQSSGLYRSPQAMGDFNGDGFHDILLGSPDGMEFGHATVIFGTSAMPAQIDLSALEPNQGFHLEGTSKTPRFGFDVSGIGDLNRDGFDDLVAYSQQSRSAHVVFGASAIPNSFNIDELDGSDGFLIPNVEVSDLSAAGDLNNDGIDDFVLGANRRPRVEYGSVHESHVIFGSDRAFPSLIRIRELDGSNGFTVQSYQGNDFLGASVSAGGDINGDGIDDLILGAPSTYVDTFRDIGETVVLFGRSGEFPRFLNPQDRDQYDVFSVVGKGTGTNWGDAVSGIGDFNGDGIDDLLTASEESYFPGVGTPGEALVVFGSSDHTPVHGQGTIDQTFDMSPGTSRMYFADGQVGASVGDISFDASVHVGVDLHVGTPEEQAQAMQHTVLQREVDLKVTVDADSQLLFPGSEFHRVVTVRNEGPHAALNFPIDIDVSDQVEGLNWTRVIQTPFDGGSHTPRYYRETEDQYAMVGYTNQMLMGSSVQGIGDVNGDGYVDLAVEAAGFQLRNSPEDAGVVFVVFGGPHGLDPYTPTFALNGENGFAIGGDGDAGNFGNVTPVGDVNGDGLDDLILSDSSVGVQEVYLLYGSTNPFEVEIKASMFDGTVGSVISSSDPAVYFGSMTSGVGDINGDGLDDFAVGAQDGTPMRVVYGKAEGYGANFDVASVDGVDGFEIGGITGLDVYRASVSGIGDINADGFDDFGIATPRRDAGDMVAAGMAHIVYGGSTLPAVLDVNSIPGNIGFRLQGDDLGQSLGRSLARVGDVNGDGLPDFAVSSTGHDRQSPEFRDSGMTHVIYGSVTPMPDVIVPTAINSDLGFNVIGYGNFSGIGRRLAGVGDFNGDGLDDILVGHDRGPHSVLIFGKSGGYAHTIDTLNLLPLEGTLIETDALVSSVGGADFDHDGLGDLVMGLSRSEVGQWENAGLVYVLSGRKLWHEHTGAGAVDDQLDLDAGAVATYVLRGTIAGSASGNASVLAVAEHTVGHLETNPADNIAATSDPIHPAPNVESIAVNAGASSRSTIDHLVVQFDTEVDHADLQTAFTIVNMSSAQTVGQVQVLAQNLSGKTKATLTFSGASTTENLSGELSSLVDGNYQLRIDAEKVRRFSVPMDGDQDGFAGGDHIFGNRPNDLFFRLFGDSDGDRDVDGLDLGAFGLAFLKTDSMPGYDPRLDHDRDGDIDGLDLGLFGRQFLKTMPHGS